MSYSVQITLKEVKDEDDLINKLHFISRVNFSRSSNSYLSSGPIFKGAIKIAHIEIERNQD